MDTNRINTIEMTRKIRDDHAKRLAGKTHAERIAFYRERAKKMQKKAAALLSGLAVFEGRRVVYPTIATATSSVREKRAAYKTKK
jgi:hypothetical protein